MEPTLLKKEDVSVMLNMPVKRAVRLLTERGVLPVDFGVGRGNGLRWHRSAVMSVIDTLHAEAQLTAGVQK